MDVYSAIRDWVDRQWRDSGSRATTLVLPGMLPIILVSLVGDPSVLLISGVVWFVVWHIFVFWRYWLYLKAVSEQADKEYDREGKYRLAQEYHDTESASAAKKREGRS